MKTSLNATVTRWTDSWPEIAARCATPPRLLVACDFDGTLAPLVSDPDKVELPPAALAALRGLQAAPGVSIAVISGRALADIAQRIPLQDVILAGNHGLEIRGLGLDGERREAAALKSRLNCLAAWLEGAVGRLPGIRIENKGLSLAVHLRNCEASHHGAVAHAVRHASLLDNAFLIQEGHMVLELIPDIGWDKGAALRQIMARLRLPRCAAFFAGDDTTDETVFQALPNGLTVRVGAARPTAARWSAVDPQDFCQLLERLARTRSTLAGRTGGLTS